LYACIGEGGPISSPAPWSVVTAALVLACWGTAALAQTYPAKTVRVIVPTGPAGGADMQGRLISKRFSESMGQQFFVDNRPGASGIIGAELVAKAPPDGYILLVTSSLIAVAAAVYPKLPYDALKDLAPIGLIAHAPQVLLAHPSVPARSVRDLVALARKQADKLNAGSAGTGSVNYIALEMLQQAAGIKVTHVPYKSGAAAVTALMGGEIDFTFSGAVQAQPLLRAGRAKALAVTSAQPSPVLPGVPTLDSVYPGFVSGNWYGMFAPAATPSAIIARLNAEIASALKASEVRELLAREGAEPAVNTPQEFGAYLRREIERYTAVARAANLKVQ
jgi:tripartite-type tricarboxylate transporter receptor subunit TctC